MIARATVVLMRFPFADGSDAERRPALVLLDQYDNDILVARLTAALRSGFDVTVSDLSAAGLVAPS